MKKDSIEKEIKLCNSILEKFKLELDDCKKDFDTLKKYENQDKDFPEYKKAAMAVKERHADLTLSVKLIKSRLEKLNEDLKKAE